MNRISTIIVVFILLLATLVLPASGASLTLNAVTFPEAKTTKLGFRTFRGATGYASTSKVEYREGQAGIEIRFDGMKPAVLFGGDVTCYVVWAVSRDGSYENLGELWMPESKGKAEFSTGRKSFAILVTAESYALVDRPSELVVMSNLAAESKKAPTDAFEFSGLGEAPEHKLDSIADIAWDSTRALDLMQAEKAYELARRSGAETYASKMLHKAQIALGQAKTLASRTKSRLDYSRRAISLSGESIQISLRRKEAEKLEKQIAERRREMKELELRAQQAEEQSSAARVSLEEAKRGLEEARRQQEMAQASVEQTQAALETATREKEAMEAQKLALEQQKSELEAQKEAVEQEKAGILSSLEGLRAERDQLSQRLEGALSKVAETRDSARGLIVNLPDILFDLNEAGLKPDTRIVIAKLAGILLMMPELQIRVEGHTDSTGSEEYNLKLSEKRAESVSSFLEAQGIDASRLVAAGYGKSRPVADNGTAEGRRKNRRVEIVIARGPGDIGKEEHND